MQCGNLPGVLGFWVQFWEAGALELELTAQGSAVL